MKKTSFLIVALVVLTESGCSMGFVPTNLTPVRPYLENWDNSEMAYARKIQDSGQCGGSYSDRPGFSSQTIKAAQQADETDLQTDFRLFQGWQRCMLNKGYRYTGKCYPGDKVSMALPACGAP